MKKADVKVGARYRAIVSGVLTTVRIDAVLERRGAKLNQTHWNATNERTGKTILIRSAQRLREEVTTPALKVCMCACGCSSSDDVEPTRISGGTMKPMCVKCRRIETGCRSESAAGTGRTVYQPGAIEARTVTEGPDAWGETKVVGGHGGEVGGP
jgi:hypothetical protein